MVNLEKIKEILNDNIEIVGEIIKEINWRDGYFEELDYYENDDDFFETMFTSKLDAVRACCYGQYNYTDEFVRLNVYGNLESFNEWERNDELKNYIDEVIEHIYDDDIDYYIENTDLKNFVDEFIENDEKDDIDIVGFDKEKELIKLHKGSDEND